MITWCALALFLVCQLMPAQTDRVDFQRVTAEVVMVREDDGGWRMTENGEDLGLYYLDGTTIRCVPSAKAQALGAEEFTVDIGTVLDLAAPIDWTTVEWIGVLSEDHGTPVRIQRDDNKTTINQRKGPLSGGVVITWPEDPS